MKQLSYNINFIHPVFFVVLIKSYLIVVVPITDVYIYIYMHINCVCAIVCAYTDLFVL